MYYTFLAQMLSDHQKKLIFKQFEKKYIVKKNS